MCRWIDEGRVAFTGVVLGGCGEDRLLTWKGEDTGFRVDLVGHIIDLDGRVTGFMIDEIGRILSEDGPTGFYLGGDTGIKVMGPEDRVPWTKVVQ